MHIVAFSLNPLYPQRVMGGAPSQLKNVMLHLGELGHTVTVLCTRRPDADAPFRWHPNVEIRPLLTHKQPFPQPYDMPAFDFAHNIQTIGDYLAQADRFYLHDGEMLFPPVYGQTPTIVSLRDNVYPETKLGGFLFQGDALIAATDFTREHFVHTAGRFWQGYAERTHVIHNGYDWSLFQPTDASALAAQFGVDPTRDQIVLHPHRPEPSKGLDQTVAVADRLVHRHGFDRLRVLVPRWFDASLSGEVRDYYDGIMRQINARGLSAHFVFHDWLDHPQMPQYFSLGHVLLSLGHFVEGHGNTVYEAAGCGTPSVVARVGPYRDAFFDGLFEPVHYGDADTAAVLAAAVLRERRRTTPATLARLHATLSIERQVAGFADVILNAHKQPPLRYRYTAQDATTRWRLAPWVYGWAGGFFNDFHATHVDLPGLAALVEAYPNGFRDPDAAAHGIETATVRHWHRRGYLVPVVD